MMRFLMLFAMLSSLASPLSAESMRLAVTTSFHNSGLADVLLPKIKSDIEIDVQLLVVGTGQALRLGAAGDVDAVLVHSKRDEEQFVKDGHGTHRREVMYNDFIIIGPKNDPANIAKSNSIKDVVDNLKLTQSFTISRGDDSGTHKKELSLWQHAGHDPESFGAWYKEVGAGMGAALNTASALDAYILSDRASWLNFKNKGTLQTLFAGDPLLFNQYAYIPVNPNKHAKIKHAEAQMLEGWLVSETAKNLINSYEIDGEKLFFFNAVK